MWNIHNQNSHFPIRLFRSVVQQKKILPWKCTEVISVCSLLITSTTKVSPWQTTTGGPGICLKLEKILEYSVSNVNNQHISAVWKFQDFPHFKWNQFWRIYLEVLKLPIFAIVAGLNFANLVNFSFQKVQNCIKNQNSEPLNVLKWQVLHF